jgi:DNA polymerase-1
MEVTGIAVDTDELRSTAADLAAECKRLEAEIHRHAGETFNVNSTPQLRGVLYDRLGLETGRKTKTGFSTNAATLEKLRGTHPIIDTILRYREVEKLRSTYGESLLSEVGADGRIHASFNQTVARTGRLSSDHPNLHNIPVRTEEGRRLRRAFVPSPGHLLLVADYDQIELRVIAHLSGDPGLVLAFEEHRDIHRATAAKVFGVAPEDVTFTQRSRAKMVSYGLAYGMESYGLAQRLGIETPEAAEILGSYFAAFPLVRDLMDRSVADARSRGYTVTLLGRRRPLPDLHSPNRGLRMAAERQAMNAGIQGLAADLFKVALVRLDGALEEGGFRSRLVLQVHDEVIVEVPTGEQSEEQSVADLTTAVLEGVADEVGLSVPLEVSIAWGSSWAEAKDHVSPGQEMAGHDLTASIDSRLPTG